jgi:hypothetical protein
MKRQNITIISLSASAIILLVVLVLVQWFAVPQTVVAGSMEARGGDYVATVANIASDVQGLFLLDARSRTVGIYFYDNNTKRVELMSSFPISEVEQVPTR